MTEQSQSYRTVQIVTTPPTIAMLFTQLRNFCAQRPLPHTVRLGWTPASPFLNLRSLPAPAGAAEIPERFSSSSLPPSFVSGRFAGFSYSSAVVVG
jgi:hypothetical protein